LLTSGFEQRFVSGFGLAGDYTWYEELHS
jgi:hypothetical protein